MSNKEPSERIVKAIRNNMHEMLGVARCPKCEGPMTARMSKRGPYFHCLGYDMAKGRCTHGDPVGSKK